MNVEQEQSFSDNPTSEEGDIVPNGGINEDPHDGYEFVQTGNSESIDHMLNQSPSEHGGEIPNDEQEEASRLTTDIKEKMDAFNNSGNRSGDRMEEDDAQQRFIESAGATEINRVLAFVKFGGSIILHIPPSKTVPLSEKLQLWKDGLVKLAQVVQEDESIKTIEGVSWIVDKHEKLVSRMGFTVKEPGILDRTFNWVSNRINGENESAHKKALMSRESFLEKYLS